MSHPLFKRVIKKKEYQQTKKPSKFLPLSYK